MGAVLSGQAGKPAKSGGFFSSEDQIEIVSKQTDYSIDFRCGDGRLGGKATVHSQYRLSAAIPVRVLEHSRMRIATAWPCGGRSPRLNAGLFTSI